MTEIDPDKILRKIKPQKSQIYEVEEKLWDVTVPNWKKRGCIEDTVKTMQKYKDDPFLDNIVSNKLTLMACSTYKDIIVREAIKYVNKPWDEYYWELRKRYPVPEWD